MSQGAGADVVTDGRTVEWIVLSASLAAPAPLREGAEIRAWTADEGLVTLRAGSNGIICLADKPRETGFHAACYAKSLEPFMEGGRELARQDDDFDPSTVDPATGSRLHAIYMAGATSASTGLPVQPYEGPWLMLPGTPPAHVMISLPPRTGR